MSIVAPRVSLSAQVQSSLKQMLMDGNFSVGECLPSEGALAEHFGVSRTTMRDAISTLVEKGFLVRRHGKGVYVVNRSENVLTDSLRNLMMRDDYTMAEFIETRQLIECQVAYLAATRATEQQIAAMETHTRNMENESNVTQYAQEDVSFHMALAYATQNRLLIAFVKAIKPMLVQMVGKVVLSGGKVESDSHFHQRILEAIRARDPEVASRRMQEHLSASEHMFRSSIDESAKLDEVIMHYSMDKEAVMP